MKTFALLVTDVVDSTKLAEELGDQKVAELWAAHDRLARDLLTVMAPKTLLQRMSQRFKLLTSSGGRRDRQATLRGALDWSWDLLSADEQAALAQVSVFEGGHQPIVLAGDTQQLPDVQLVLRPLDIIAREDLLGEQGGHGCQRKCETLEEVDHIGGLDDLTLDSRRGKQDVENHALCLRAP